MTDKFCHLVTLSDIQFDFNLQLLLLKRPDQLNKHLFIIIFSLKFKTGPAIAY